MIERLKEHYLSLDTSSRIKEIKKIAKEIENLNNKINKFKNIEFVAGKNNSSKSSKLANQNQLLCYYSDYNILLKFYVNNL